MCALGYPLLTLNSSSSQVRLATLIEFMILSNSPTGMHFSAVWLVRLSGLFIVLRLSGFSAFRPPAAGSSSFRYFWRRELHPLEFFRFLCVRQLRVRIASGTSGVTRPLRRRQHPENSGLGRKSGSTPFGCRKTTRWRQLSRKLRGLCKCFRSNLKCGALCACSGNCSRQEQSKVQSSTCTK